MTKQTQHTPGPWEVATDGATVLAGQFDEFVADCQSDGYNAESAYDQDRANARLIAAAPELLEACRNSLNALWAKGANHTGEQYPNEEDVTRYLSPQDKKLFVELKQAIAKAKGE